MEYTIETTLEDDGRWTARIKALAVEIVGPTRDLVVDQVRHATFGVLADRAAHGELQRGPVSFEVRGDDDGHQTTLPPPVVVMAPPASVRPPPTRAEKP